jgi:hypothetical protein
MERTQLSAIVLDLLEKETGETYDALEDSTTLNEGLGLGLTRYGRPHPAYRKPLRYSNRD